MGLGFVFTARDLASAKMAGLERRFRSLDDRVTGGAARITSAFRQLALGLAVFTAGAIPVGAALSMANAAGHFEQGLAAVGAVTRATTRELGMLRDAAIQAGIETQFSPDEAVAGLTSLATAGQTAAQATRTLIPVLDLAAGSLGQLGVAQAAEAVVGTLNAYGMAADQASGVTDKLLRITQLTNFQTRDFEAGLAKAAATGGVFNQSLDDVLVTMGLLRNRNIDASSSATAFREALRRVGSDARAQQAVTGAGVKIFDKQSGAMRSIVDVMDDFARETASMTEEERNRRVVTAFGARGLLAFNAILNASFTTMRDGREVTLKGAEAIAALRTQLGAAEGTAAGFREKLLDTFEGQKTLLRGTLQTYAVVFGEPFAQVLKPLVRIVVETLNVILRAFQAIPAPVKRVFAGITLAVGSFLMLVGGAIAAKATIALLVIGLKALGITIGSLVATLLPAILVVGLLAVTVVGFVQAFRNNIGGLGDFARRVWDRIQLAFEGIAQLFQQGGFSGAVREELNRAENQGLKGFLINVFLWAERIKTFFAGIADGFSQGIEAAGPTLDAFMAALRQLGNALGFLSERDNPLAAGEKFEAFGETGAKVGRVLARVFELVVRGLTAVVEVAEGVVRWWWLMKAGVDVLGDTFSTLGTKLGELVGSFGSSTSAAQETGSAWTSLGNVFALLITVITSVIGVLVSAISAAVGIINAAIHLVIDVFSGLADVVTGVVFVIGGIFNGSWKDVWTGMKLIAFGVIEAVMGAVLELAGAIGGVVDSIAGLFGKTTHLQKLVQDTKKEFLGDMAKGMGVEGLAFAHMTPTSAASARPAFPVAAGPLPAVAAVAAVRALAPAAGPVSQAPKAVLASMPPINVSLQVDGETLARASHRAEQDDASRSFSPVPAY